MGKTVIGIASALGLMFGFAIKGLTAPGYDQGRQELEWVIERLIQWLPGAWGSCTHNGHLIGTLLCTDSIPGSKKVKPTPFASRESGDVSDPEPPCLLTGCHWRCGRQSHIFPQECAFHFINPARLETQNAKQCRNNQWFYEGLG